MLKQNKLGPGENTLHSIINFRDFWVLKISLSYENYESLNRCYKIAKLSDTVHKPGITHNGKSY